MTLNPLSQPSTSARNASLVIPALTMGFGTSVAMWAVGFITHLPVVKAPAEVVGVLLLIVLSAGMFLAGRAGGLKLGAASGFAAGLVNLLILGSLIAKHEPGSGVQPNAALMVGGWIAFATLIGAIFGAVGSRFPCDRPNDTRSWIARFSVVAAISALPVLLSGGLVTSTDSGLAVPDWPSSYGSNMFLFPLSKMTGGIYYEHAHRLFGSLVGLNVLTLMLVVLFREPRKWVKLVAVGAFLIVLAQGILGGTGVTAAQAHTPTTAEATAALPTPDKVPSNYATRTDTNVSRGMRMVHGITGQLTFAYLCMLGVFLSTSWSNTGRPIPRDFMLRVFTAALFITLVLQLSIGAGLRHTGHVAFMHSHITVAFIVLVIATLAGSRAAARAKENNLPGLRRLGKAVVHTIGLQVVLGLVTLWLVMPYDRADPPAGIALATAHQAVGALLLGLTTLLVLWTRRLMAS